MKPIAETGGRRLWRLSDETILEGEVPEQIKEPWAMLLIDHDGDWSSDFVDKFTENSIKLGCRFFLVSGQSAEDWEETIVQVSETMAPEEQVVVQTLEDAEVDEAVEDFLNYAKDQENMADLSVVFLDLGDYDESDYLEQLESMLE